ncbi:MAG: Deoxyribose-phosphate aldolase [Candidatus Bathyarchaeota archaeon BA2]|nr:MAG: Deoxyribose-phosphate aldolase [Candidatus Bathyarchaeota archaeon BA2]
MDRKQLAKMIDYTLLKPDATEDDIIKVCKEATKYNFASVCINPVYVSLATKLLKGTGVKVCTVVGFPLGANAPEIKAFEAKNAIEKGAQEIDMVMNIGALKSGNYELVKKDMTAVIEVAKERNVVTKVILECGFLTDEEKVTVCKLAKEAGADFVKTSTGFGPSGATIHDVKILKKVVGGNIGVKAAGGIRSYKDALMMIKAGADRIGASAGVEIVKELKER